MTRGQISVEFAIVFGALFVLFFFAAAFVPQWLRASADPQEEAEVALAALQLHTVTASTAVQDYVANVTIPAQLGGERVSVQVFPYPDNVAVLNTSTTVLARVDLPIIRSVTDDPTLVGAIRVRKDASGVSIET